MSGNYEYCNICNEKTGRAGAGEDSIYCEVIKRTDDLFREGTAVCDEGMYAGPLCEDCYDEMNRLGFFEDE